VSPVIFKSPGTEWDRVVGITGVECPDCAFTFDAAHEDEGGGYSCPLCSEIALQAEVERLREALDSIATLHSLHDTKADRAGHMQTIARQALNPPEEEK